MGDKPSVTEIWPRVGSVRGSTVTLHGIHMDEVVAVRLIFKDSVVNLVGPTYITLIDDRRLELATPMLKPNGTAMPVGLAQVQVQRQKPDTTRVWGTQYFGYFVLD